MMQKAQLEAIVGAPNVSDDTASLDAFARDLSFVNPVRPACVVRPADAAAIQKLIHLANETRTPLVPVSSGAPHFRGDTVPGMGGAVIVDLSGMKKILFVDRDRRVAMCEPGVTFGELIPAARKVGLRLNMPLLPRATKSVVASILEREPVTMPKYQWDASDPLACAGICFGTGDEFRTGQAAGPGTLEEQWAVGGMQKAPYGPGTPSLHRLFQGAQGTIGIVTWMSLRCELLPAIEQPFVVGSADLDELLELSYWLVRMNMVNECFVLNAANVAAMFTTTAAQRRKLKATLPAWTLFYTVAGYEYFPEERVASHVADITAITQRLNLEARHAVAGVAANEILKAVQQPSADPYWKLRPLGGCHDVLYLTQRGKLTEQVEAVSNLADQAGHAASEIGVYIQPQVQGTSHHCEFNLFYDPADARERARVRDLDAAATRALLARGAFFSRPYGEGAAAIVNRDAASASVLHTFKRIFDPNNVMNPGKVCF
ncbi:MAG: FAD-binding oxidoreductase [Gammaproteobacteria bacterium]|nr:FAD-binding oxidoreductase [Gammaproteobacteria bacterium]